MDIMYAQIYKLTAIRAIRAFLITMPIIVIYWQSFGLAVRDIFVLQVIFSVAIVVLEIPTGYFADRFGKKLSIVLSTVAGTLGFFFYYALPSYFGFVLAELTLALSVGLLSGANSALLFETLKEYGEEGLYQKFQGRLLAIGTTSEAIAAVLAGLIVYSYSVETVFFVQWIVLAFTIPLALSLREVNGYVKQKAPALLSILRGSFHENERLKYLNVYAGAINAATLTMVWFSQSHWKELGIDIVYFGYMWAGLNLMVAGGAMLAHKLEKRIRFRTLFGIMAFGPLILYVAMGIWSTSLFVLLVVPLFWFLRGVKTPIIEDYVQRECKDGERATVLSINALSSRLIFSIFSPFVGWIADIWSFGTAFLVSGVIFGSLSLISFLFLYGAMHRANRA